MRKETDYEIWWRERNETLRADLIEINRCSYADVARIVEIMDFGAREGGDDPRVRSGIHRLRKLFGSTGAPDELGAALAETEALRARVNDPSTSEEDADRMLRRLLELDDIVCSSRASSFASVIPAMREARREWRKHYARVGGRGHAYMSALLDAVDALPLTTPRPAKEAQLCAVS